MYCFIFTVPCGPEVGLTVNDVILASPSSLMGQALRSSQK